MSKTKLIFALALAIFGMAFFVSAQAAAPAVIDNTVNCFDYYKFGSVQVDVESDINSTVSGVPMTFKATIKNDNNYPIVEGAVYAKVFKKNNGDDTHANGHSLVDQFFVQENISLNAKENKPLEFTWQIPGYALSGDYQIAMFFTSAKKFNLLGLSFTDDVVGNIFDFTVAGELQSNVEFNKNTVDINGKNYHFAAFPPRFKDEDITVKTELVNSTNESQATKVSHKLYSWDGQTEDNLVAAKEEIIQLQAKETKQLTYTIQENKTPVYYLVIEAQYQDTKSILDIRTVRENNDKVRINFPAITSYPLKQNEKNTLFVCAHNSGTKDVIENNKLVMTILDENQKEIHQYTYEGKISGAMMGLKEDFTPEKTSANFTIKTELYTDNQLVDSATMKYDCKQLNKDLCPARLSEIFTTSSNKKTTTPIILGIIFFLIGILVIIYFRKKKTGMNLLILGIVTTSMLLGGMGKVEAKSAVYSAAWPTPDSYDTGEAGLANPSVSVTYVTTLKNTDTGAIISDGATLTVGTRFTALISHNNTDISWFGTGYNNDSPYGYWLNGAGPTPPNENYVVSVDSSYSGEMYYSLSINPPTKNFSSAGSTAGLVCSANGQCTITSPGTINATFVFNATNAQWWLSTGASTINSQTAVAAPNIPIQTITFNLTAVGGNKAPSAPTVTCPATGVTGTDYDFTATATDPDGDTLKYSYDWDNNGVGDQNVPASGYVNSGIAQTAKHQWVSTGSKTIKVQACDSKNNCSAGWGSCTIVIGDKPTGAWTANCPNNCGVAASSVPYVCTGGNSICSGTAPADKACSATAACPVPGTCNPATNGKLFTSKPTANLCSIGNPSVVSGSSIWNWTCLNDGITSSCSATCSVSGSPSCGSYGDCGGFCNGGAGVKTRSCMDNCGTVSLDSVACINTTPCASSPMKWTEL